MSRDLLIILLGNLNFFFLVFAATMRNILYLRLITLLSSVCAISYYFIYADQPLWVNISWETFFLSINLAQIALLFYEKRQSSFKTKEEKELYDKVFYHLTPRQFKKLLAQGEFIHVEKGAQLTVQGQPVDHLAVIFKGIASVTRDGKSVAYCKEGNFVGEISFVNEIPATATVEALEPMHYLQWRQEELRDLFERDRDLPIAMKAVFSADLIRKLTSGKVTALGS